MYTGGGSSHSWLWFADIFERLGFWDLTFLDEIDLAGGALEGLEVLAVSGGDTFGMAEALGPRGAKALARFIKAGGVYLGACAGAYLPLNSSKKPLNLFNWVAAKITNLSSTLPQAQDLPQKFCTPYGCSYVFHPVREEVMLSTSGSEPFGPARKLAAPLYGGPGMIASKEVEVLAEYEAFTARTRFLVEEPLAAETLLGTAAVIRSQLGQGWLYLFGPHFEHPHFREANALVARSIYWNLATGKGRVAARDAGPAQTRADGKWLTDLKREVSNSRIVALGLEDHPARWLIGRKVYEPAKFRVFCEAVWSRLAALDKAGHGLADEHGREALVSDWRSITAHLRALKNELDQGQDTQPRAEVLIPQINRSCSRFMQMYFQSTLAGLSSRRGRQSMH